MTERLKKTLITRRQITKHKLLNVNKKTLDKFILSF